MRQAYEALDAWFKAFHYAPRPGVTGAYVCRHITNGVGDSLHAFEADESFTFWSGVTVHMAIACDTNWDTNPYGPRLVTDRPRAMVEGILGVRTVGGAGVWAWGGLFPDNKDAMHDQIACGPFELASGIDPATLPHAEPIPDPVSSPKEFDMKWLLRAENEPAVYVYDGQSRVAVPSADALGELGFLHDEAKRVNGVGMFFQPDDKFLDGSHAGVPVRIVRGRQGTPGQPGFVPSFWDLVGLS